MADDLAAVLSDTGEAAVDTDLNGVSLAAIIEPVSLDSEDRRFEGCSIHRRRLYVATETCPVLVIGQEVPHGGVIWLVEVFDARDVLTEVLLARNVA